MKVNFSNTTNQFSKYDRKRTSAFRLTLKEGKKTPEYCFLLNTINVQILWYLTLSVMANDSKGCPIRKFG